MIGRKTSTVVFVALLVLVVLVSAGCVRPGPRVSFLHDLPLVHEGDRYAFEWTPYPDEPWQSVELVASWGDPQSVSWVSEPDCILEFNAGKVWSNRGNDAFFGENDKRIILDCDRAEILQLNMTAPSSTGDDLVGYSLQPYVGSEMVITYFPFLPLPLAGKSDVPDIVSLFGLNFTVDVSEDSRSVRLATPNAPREGASSGSWDVYILTYETDAPFPTSISRHLQASNGLVVLEEERFRLVSYEKGPGDPIPFTLPSWEPRSPELVLEPWGSRLPGGDDIARVSISEAAEYIETTPEFSSYAEVHPNYWQIGAELRDQSVLNWTLTYQSDDAYRFVGSVEWDDLAFLLGLPPRVWVSDPVEVDDGIEVSTFTGHLRNLDAVYADAARLAGNAPLQSFSFMAPKSGAWQVYAPPDGWTTEQSLASSVTATFIFENFNTQLPSVVQTSMVADHVRYLGFRMDLG